MFSKGNIEDILKTNEEQATPNVMWSWLEPWSDIKEMGTSKNQ